MVLSGKTYHIFKFAMLMSHFFIFSPEMSTHEKMWYQHGELKMWYVFPESTIDAYIVENFHLDIKKHFWKILGKFSQVFTLFHNTFHHTKKSDFFASKHAGLQRTLKLRFSHQRGALKIHIPYPRRSVYDLYDIKLSFYD